MKQPYTKPVLTIDEQIQHLRQKGMSLNDEEQARQYLRFVSYYRLSAYWLPFEFEKAEQEQNGCFKSEANFEQVIKLYEFDLKLRQLLYAAISDVEIAVRGTWAYHLAQLGCGHSYLEKEHYRDEDKFDKNKDKLKEEFSNSKEVFAEHYRNKYTEELPPVWMASEILSFGSLSHWYANLKNTKIRKSISKNFLLHHNLFQTYIHHLSVVRNICAHHGRLWNRIIKPKLKLADHPANLSKSLSREKPNRIYNTLVMLAFTREELFSDFDWRDQIIAHVKTLPFGELNQLGFPENWEELPVWKVGKV